MSKLPRLSLDKVNPGVIRIAGTDAMTGILAGMRAPEIVHRCNAHDALVAALKLVRGEDAMSGALSEVTAKAVRTALSQAEQQR